MLLNLKDIKGANVFILTCWRKLLNSHLRVQSCYIELIYLILVPLWKFHVTCKSYPAWTKSDYPLPPVQSQVSMHILQFQEWKVDYSIYEIEQVKGSVFSYDYSLLDYAYMIIFWMFWICQRKKGRRRETEVRRG